MTHVLLLAALALACVASSASRWETPKEVVRAPCVERGLPLD
ncbi:hypothetical protein BY998_12748 [Methylobacterium sp. B4]|nr:hypothetical protein BY998_12748 [Methylobacterium sp. B4]